MRLDRVTAYRLEGPRADVQRHACDGRTARGDRVEHGLVEMQAGGRRSDRARLLGEHRLVAFGVLRVVRVPDIGRQRHVAAALQHGGHRFGEAHAEQIVLAAEHFGLDAVAEDQAMTSLEGVAGARKGQRLAFGHDALDENLDLAAGGFAAEQPRLEDARVVQYDDILRRDQRRQIEEAPVVQRAGSVEMQQAALRAFGRGMLRDELFGQRVVEIAQAHSRTL